MAEQGLIHIYCGDGKGKTTAAFGLAFRCAGRGNNVVILQFLKGNVTGEVLAAEKFPNMMVIRGNQTGKFTFQMSEADKENARLELSENFENAVKRCEAGDIRLLVIDEIMAAWNNDLIDRQRVLEFLKNKPDRLEVVMTGRNPPEALIKLADYVSEIKKIKHPFDCGIPARDGIER